MINIEYVESHEVTTEDFKDILRYTNSLLLKKSEDDFIRCFGLNSFPWACNLMCEMFNIKFTSYKQIRYAIFDLYNLERLGKTQEDPFSSSVCGFFRRASHD